MKLIERKKRDRSCFYTIQPTHGGNRNEFLTLRYDFLGEVKKTAYIFFGEHNIDVKRDLLAKILRKARNESK